MLIALSGAQGSGKTTVINGLKNLGYNVIERKTARSVLADWKVTLEQVYADQDLCKKFHDELLTRKQEDELASHMSDDLRFTERSFADLFTYALISLGHFNKYSDWLDQYYIDCKKANTNYFGVFFLNTPRFRPTEHDGVRGTNKHYVRQVDSVVADTVKRMSYSDEGFPREITPLIEVRYESIDERVRYVAEKAHDLWLTERLHIDNNYYQTCKHPARIEAERRMKENINAVQAQQINI